MMIFISLVAMIFFTDCVEWYFLPKNEIHVLMGEQLYGFGDKQGSII